MQSAKTRFSILYNNIKHLPPIIGDLLHKLSKIFNKIQSTTTYMDDIPSTNNKLERHYGVTIPGYLKKRYITNQGLEIHLNFAEYRWTQRNTKKTTKTVSF